MKAVQTRVPASAEAIHQAKLACGRQLRSFCAYAQRGNKPFGCVVVFDPVVGETMARIHLPANSWISTETAAGITKCFDLTYATIKQHFLLNKATGAWPLGEIYICMYLCIFILCIFLYI